MVDSVVAVIGSESLATTAATANRK